MVRFNLRFSVHTVTIGHPATTIGRGSDCAIRLEGRTISRLHATLLLDDRGLFVRDEQSKNGVFVNGQRVTGTVPLVMGDTLSIGTEEIFVHVDASLERSATGEDVPTRDYGPKDITTTQATLGHLSQRERQVFKLLAQGFENREIAARLELSPKTVATYRARLYEKLELRSRADLVEVALKTGMLAGG